MMNKISPVIKINNIVLNNMEDILENRQNYEILKAFYSNNLILWMENKGLLNEEVDVSNKEISYYYKLLYGTKSEEILSKDKNEFSDLISEFSHEFQSKKSLETACKNILKYENFLMEQPESEIKKQLFKFSDNVFMFSLFIYYKNKRENIEVYNKLNKIIGNLFDALKEFKLFTTQEINENSKINKPFMLVSVGDGTIVEINIENQSFVIDKNNFYEFKNKIFEKADINMINPRIFSEIKIVEVDYVLK